MSHEERNHALLSASSAHRWLACTPSARLEEQFPDTTSEAAKEGTLAHELAELKVRNYFKPHDVSKRKLTFAIKKMKENPLWDDEMLEHTDTYIDYIRDVSIKLAIRSVCGSRKTSPVRLLCTRGVRYCGLHHDPGRNPVCGRL